MCHVSPRSVVGCNARPARAGRRGLQTQRHSLVSQHSESARVLASPPTATPCVPVTDRATHLTSCERVLMSGAPNSPRRPSRSTLDTNREHPPPSADTPLPHLLPANYDVCHGWLQLPRGCGVAGRPMRPRCPHGIGCCVCSVQDRKGTCFSFLVRTFPPTHVLLFPRPPARPTISFTKRDHYRAPFGQPYPRFP